MNVSAACRGALCSAANQELTKDAVICRDPEKLSWIAETTSSVIQEVQNSQRFGGAELNNSNPRRAMHREITNKVKAKAVEEKCGFIFITIVLGAILSWLIQRLLDRLFTGEFNLD